MPGRYFDEWKIGDRVSHAVTRTVTETDNVLISTLTHNPQPLHLDHEAAAKSEFGKPIVNSVFTFGLMIGDSVAPAMKPVAREVLKNLLKRSGGPQWWVRVNPLGSRFHKDDLEILGLADIHGIVLPKAESGDDVSQLAHRTGNIPVHAIVTETPTSLFGLMSYRNPTSPLAAMSWGAEDLSA